MSRRVTVWLNDSEAERLQAIGRNYSPDGQTAGISTMAHLAVIALLGDPLPRWFERLMDELLAA